MHIFMQSLPSLAAMKTTNIYLRNNTYTYGTILILTEQYIYMQSLPSLAAMKTTKLQDADCANADTYTMIHGVYVLTIERVLSLRNVFSYDIQCVVKMRRSPMCMCWCLFVLCVVCAFCCCVVMMQLLDRMCSLTIECVLLRSVECVLLL
jgi:hypothetical protein